MGEGEWKVLYNEHTVVQKVLNEWEHQYMIEIKGFAATHHMHGREQVHVLVYRTPKCVCKLRSLNPDCLVHDGEERNNEPTNN